MSHGIAASLERDLLVVEAMAADLKEYLLSSTLYWSLSKPRPGPLLPKGTLGGLLLRLHRLTALEASLTPDQRQRLSDAAGLARQTLDRWAAQAEEKALREIKARLGAWQAYLEECEDNTPRYAPEYPTQAESRTAIDLLLGFAGKAVGARLAEQVRVADQRLSALVEPGGFVWDEAFALAFPPERFWWLYAQFAPPDDQS